MNSEIVSSGKVKNWNESWIGSITECACSDLKNERETHLDTGFNVDGGDLLDDLGGAVEVNHSLVDPHLELVPGLGTLSARSLPGGDSQHLGGHPHWSLHLELLVLGAPDEVAADLLQRLDVPGGQSDSDAVDGDILLLTFTILKN